MKRIVLALSVLVLLSGCAGMGGFFDTKGGPPSAPPYRLTDAEIAAGTATTPGLITAKQYTDNLAAGSGINNVVEDLTPQLGGDLDQNGHNINITDTGSIITATTLDAALQEHRTAINLNTAKNTNVPTALSVGTVDASTVSITSDGGADDVTLPAATNAAAGVATAAQITALEGAESHTSNDFDPDRLSGDTTDDNLVDGAILGECSNSKGALPTTSGITDGYVPKKQTDGSVLWAADSTGAGGSAITFDIGDDGGNDSTDVNEIATSGDTNAIFTEPSADKILIDLTKNWPAADSATSAAGLSGDLDPDQLSGDTVDDNLIDQNIVAGLTTSGSASPGFTAYDSDSPGADKTAGFIGWQYIDGADGAENSDWLLQIMQAGTLTTVLYFDESDDQFETTKVINSSGGFTGNLTGNASGSAGSVAVGNITGAGTGVLTALAVNVGSAGAPVLYDGALGTPSGGTLTNCTGLPAAGLGTDADDDAIEFVIDGGGSAITTGVKGFIEIPYACTVNSVTLLADQSCSAVVDLWVDSYANYPPTDANTITSSTPPTITTAVKSQDTTLTSWTTSLTKGQVIGFNVDSNDSAQRITVSIKVDK